MAHDPHLLPLSTEQALADKVAKLERRVAVLERARVTVWTGSGPPSGTFRSGVLYIDEVTGKLWARIGVNWGQIN
jgi:hypothetical protein